MFAPLVQQIDGGPMGHVPGAPPPYPSLMGAAGKVPFAKDEEDIGNSSFFHIFSIQFFVQHF